MKFIIEGNRKPENRGRHKPLKLFSEMAEELGLSVRSLTRIKTYSPVKFPNRRFVGNENKFYCDPDEVRAWWKAHNEAAK